MLVSANGVRIFDFRVIIYDSEFGIYENVSKSKEMAARHKSESEPPTSSPDVASTDYHLLGLLRQHLAGNCRWRFTSGTRARSDTGANAQVSVTTAGGGTDVYWSPPMYEGIYVRISPSYRNDSYFTVSNYIVNLSSGIFKHPRYLINVFPVFNNALSTNSMIKSQ
jgi:hypothetical protein